MQKRIKGKQNVENRIKVSSEIFESEKEHYNESSIKYHKWCFISFAFGVNVILNIL